jgi:predicted RNA-binding protein YlqC (UPF0109 family)
MKSSAELLLDYPSSMELSITETSNTMTVEVFVEPSDVGNMLGKSGKIAKAIRHLAFCGASRDRMKLSIFVMGKK